MPSRRISGASRRRLFALLLVALTASAGEARSVGPRNPRFEHLSIEHGLSQAFVRTIVQDRRGFLWFGTQAGLNRYDGYQFVPYAEDPDDPSALSNNLVKDVLEAANGDLWVATEGGGVDRLPFGRLGFEHHRFDPEDPASLSSDRARSLLETSDGRLWVGSDDGFLDVIEPGSGSFRHVEVPSAQPKVAAAVRALSEHDGRLWVGTEGAGLITVDLETLEVLAVHRTGPGDEKNGDGTIGDDSICSLLHDDDGTLWIGTCGGGLSLRRVGTERFETFRSSADDPSSLCSNHVYSLFRDRGGSLWVGTDNGLCEWEPRTQTFYRYRHDPADPRSLANNHVAAIFQDDGGVLWLGNQHGLSYWLTANQEFRQHNREDRPGGLTADMVTSFAEAPNGDIWVGTYGGGLNRLSLETGRFSSFRHDDRRPESLADDRVMSLHTGSDGALWIGTLAGGLDRLDPDADGFTHHRHDPDDPTSLSTDGVTVLLEDRDRLWVGTYRGGLNRLDLATGSFTRFRHSRADPGTISSDQVLALLIDREGDLLVASEGGLDRIDRETDGVTRVPVRAGEDVADDVSLHVFSLAESTTGDLWLGTQGAGVILWTAEDRRADRHRFEVFDTEDGLASDVAYGLLFDAAGDLWVSSNDGLSRLSPEGGAVRTYDSTHGLQSDEFNFGAQLRARNGRLYFGGIHGFSDFDPALVRDNTHIPPVAITGIYRNNRPLSTEVPVSDVDRLELDHQDYIVTIEFAGLDFAAPRKNRYRYRLEGLEKDWIEAGSLRRATYTNLGPGNYTFRVQASNNDDYWNEAGAQLRMRIHPAPWRTKTAYAGYSLALAALIGIYARGQSRKRQRASVLARTNESLTREIEQRREKERELERAEEKARTYLDVAEVIMLALDQDGRVTLINQRGCRTLGVLEQDILGKPWCDQFLHPDVREEARESFENPRPGTFEAPIATRRGERRIVVWESTTLPADQDQASGGALFSGADITEMRWLAEAKEAAESASLAKSQFLANISHEIRTPMGGVLGMIELLQGTPLSDRQRGHVESARRSANHLLDILNDILDFSKVEAGRLELDATCFEISELVRDVADLFADAARAKELVLECTVAPDVPPLLYGDTKRLRQILANLVGNAVKFTDRGRVELRVSRDRSEDEEEAWIRFEVEDTGIGIPPDLAEHIFEAFRQADGSTTRRFGGTGLGLAIAKQLTEAMGGEIDFESRPGGGTRFWFVAPLEDARSEESPTLDWADSLDGEPVSDIGPVLLENADEPPSSTDLAGLRCLVAEDNPVMQQVVRHHLRAAGGEVECVENGVEAVARCLEQGFDVLLMDCQMPLLDGYAATRSIRESEASGDREHTLIIAMTAHAMAGDREKCLAAGMDSYISKPLSQDGLLSVIREALRTHRCDSDSSLGEPDPDARRTESEVSASEMSESEASGSKASGLSEPGESPLEGSRTSSAVDGRTLEDLARQSDRGRDLVDQLVAIYRESSPQHVTGLETALEAGDLERAAHCVHTLRSSSLTIGATHLAALCRRAEEAANAGDLPTLERIAGEVRDEYACVVQELDETQERGSA